MLREAGYEWQLNVERNPWDTAAVRLSTASYGRAEKTMVPRDDSKELCDVRPLGD
jgi:predicted RNA-binding protein